MTSRYDEVSGWEAYWLHTREAAAHRDGGPQDQVLGQFWTTLFREFLPRHPRARMLDLACGNGVVTHHALAVASQLGQSPPLIVGLDRSLAATAQWRQRFSSSTSVVANAARTPFPDLRFQLVASQFGIEYAGLPAVTEAGRLVAPAGAFAAVLHLAGGGIHRECQENLRALDTIRQSELLPRLAAFLAASAPLHGGSKSRLRRADERLSIAMRVLERTLTAHGRGVAGGALARLQQDAAHMYQRRQAYEPRAVVAWSERMAAELASYRERMATMVGAAIDDAGMDVIVDQLASTGLRTRVRERLIVGSKGEEAAWVLICERPVRSDS